MLLSHWTAQDTEICCVLVSLGQSEWEKEGLRTWQKGGIWAQYYQRQYRYQKCNVADKKEHELGKQTNLEVNASSSTCQL